jgi:putative transposase
MGRVGAAGDNAAMESFFNLLQTNVLDRHRWSTGSRRPTTADAANAPSANSPPSSSRPCTNPRQPQHDCHPNLSPQHGADPRSTANQETAGCRDDLAVAVITWIEKTYNRRRRQRALGKLTPIEFETLHQPTAAAA